MSDSKEELVYEAKLSEQVERFDDMMEKMTKVVKTFKNQTLSIEERNLLSVAFKNVIGAKRASWRILSSLESKLEDKDEQKKRLLTSYKKEVEKELNDTSNKIVTLIDEYLLKEDKALEAESKIFYLKMKGDYKRYLAEFCTDEARQVAADESCQSYTDASNLAADELKPTHPIRLGLALNFSVFYYEILNAPDRACRLAKAAFDDAISELDQLNEDSYKDSTLIMQLLRDNLTLWTSDIDGGEAEEVELEDVDSKEK